MSENILRQNFVELILSGLKETFENVQGIYLDRNTSLFETLETITAEEASRPTADDCASIAAHVEHMRVSIEAVLQYMRGEQPQVDWTDVWRTVREVTPEEWSTRKTALHESYQQLLGLIADSDTWDDNMRLIMGILMHSAYHLGEIRQLLCTVQSGS